MRVVPLIAMLALPALAAAQVPPDRSAAAAAQVASAEAQTPQAAPANSPEQAQAQLQVTWQELQSAMIKLIAAQAESGLLSKRVESLQKQLDATKAPESHK